MKTRVILFAMLFAAALVAGGCYSAASRYPNYGSVYDYENYGYGPYSSWWGGYPWWGFGYPTYYGYYGRAGDGDHDCDDGHCAGAHPKGHVVRKGPSKVSISITRAAPGLRAFSAPMESPTLAFGEHGGFGGFHGGMRLGGGGRGR